MATSDDVARAAGVSRGAVSQILNGRGDRFAASTRERVRRAAEDLSYDPSFAGRALARGRSEAVVVLIPHTTFGGHLQGVIEGATLELGRRGYTLLTYFEAAGLAPLARLVAAVRPAALLPLGGVSPGVTELLEADGDVVLVNDTAERQRSGRSVGALQADHLIAKGYRLLRYAGFHDVRKDVYGADRQAGFEHVCRERGVECLPAWDVELTQSSVRGAMSGRLAAPLGVGCYNDEVALALLGAARDVGVAVPGQLGLVGVDRMPLGQALPQRLTTVSYDALAMGRSAARVALARLGHATDQTDAPVFSVLEGATT